MHFFYPATEPTTTAHNTGSMNIKVCGMKHPENIEALLPLEPDMIGFIFYQKSKRYAGSENGLAAYMPYLMNVQKVGVFVNAPIHEVLATTAMYRLDMVQLHGDESPEYAAALGRRIPIMKAFAMQEDFDFSVLEAYKTSCRYFLFDTPTTDFGGSGRSFDWSLLQHQDVPRPFFLSGGIDEKNAREALLINHPSLHGIDVNSRFETAPGCKDISKLKTLFHEIRN